jgi:hypothetical protein
MSAGMTERSRFAVASTASAATSSKSRRSVLRRNRWTRRIATKSAITVAAVSMKTCVAALRYAKCTDGTALTTPVMSAAAAVAATTSRADAADGVPPPSEAERDRRVGHRHPRSSPPWPRRSVAPRAANRSFHDLAGMAPASPSISVHPQYSPPPTPR